MADKIEGRDSADAGKKGEKRPKRDEKSTEESSPNVFKNDGSFLEMFKKKLEAGKQPKQSCEQVVPDSSCSSNTSTSSSSATTTTTTDETQTTTTDETKTNRLKNDETESAGKSDESEQKRDTAVKKKYSLLSHVGKRPGSKLTLKTGQVKKPKSDKDSAPKDAWSRYMAEVAEYKSHVCGDDDKNRPLVK